MSRFKWIVIVSAVIGLTGSAVFAVSFWRRPPIPLSATPQRLYSEVLSDPSVVKSLLDRGATPDYRNPLDRDRTCLFRTITFGKLETCRLLLDAGADVNVKDKNGITPLMECAIWFDADKLEIARLLLKRGADPNAKAYGDGQGYLGIFGEISVKTILDRKGNSKHNQEFRKLIGVPPKAPPQPERIFG